MSDAIVSSRKIRSHWVVESNNPVRYEVKVVSGLFNPDNPTISNVCEDGKSSVSRALIVIDKTVDKLYGDMIKNYFSKRNVSLEVITIDGDEEHKNIDHVLKVADKISEVGLLRRSEKIIVIGGGVAMDVVGLAANLFRRGIPYVRIPTTLMGQVDAGIGIKTGVNYGSHKNRLGTYNAPVSAFIDPAFLRTLPQKHITNGIAEIIKMALVKDYRLFEILEENVDNFKPELFGSPNNVHLEILERSINGMLEELEPNLWEDDLERIVDYGHTFSPSLELIADPILLHGEAVAIDMALCVGLSYTKKLIDKVTAFRAVELIKNCDLPIRHPVFTIELLEKALKDTVKHRDGLQRVPLIDRIGHAVFCNDLTKEDLEKGVNFIDEFSNVR